MTKKWTGPNPNRYRPWSEKEESLVGTATDRAVALRIGRSETAVLRKRQSLDVSAFEPHRRDWTKGELSLLGKLSDAKVAKRLDCSRKCVIEKRQELGIGCASPRNTPRKFRRRKR